MNSELNISGLPVKEKKTTLKIANLRSGKNLGHGHTKNELFIFWLVSNTFFELIKGE